MTLNSLEIEALSFVEITSGVITQRDFYQEFDTHSDYLWESLQTSCLINTNPEGNVIITQQGIEALKVLD
jgi:hypothetical protein